MLLQFKISNYKSFREETSFSMMKESEQTALQYSILREKIGRKTLKGLSSAVIYGPNASGKTNLIGAMDTFRSIVLRGNIRNSDEQNSPNTAASWLELIPNNTGKEPMPVEFSIAFTTQGKRIDYGFSADLGLFGEREHPRKILKEYFSVDGKPVFERTGEKLEIHTNAQQAAPFSDSQEGGPEAEITISLLMKNLDPEELFLTNGYKSILSVKNAALVTDWLRNQFMVIYRADSLELLRRFSDPSKQSMEIDKTITSAAKRFGIGANLLAYISDPAESTSKLYSLIKSPTSKEGIALPAEYFESYGTIRFINMFPLVVRALLTGGTLVVDEFDASIHPMALMNIINIFHNDTLNIHNAQLVFNTHNPIFLNSSLFRKDEIKFVDRDGDTNFSTQYALSDFGPSVSTKADFMKNYFVDQYGAVHDIDFTPIFEEILHQKEAE